MGKVNKTKNANGPYGRKQKKREKLNEDEDAEIVDWKTSKKIIDIAKSQREEIERESKEELAHAPPKNKLENHDSDDDLNMMDDDEFYGDSKLVIPEGLEKEFEFCQSISDEKRNETFVEKASLLKSEIPDPESIELISEELKSVYKNIGAYFNKYSSGPIPQQFKYIADVRLWKELLLLTEPENWSAAAMFQATKILTRQLKGDNLANFYEEILLPRVRDDMVQYKKLNHHLYQALKVATLKPLPFFQGIIFKLLVDEEECTLNEAIIMSSILAQAKFPVHRAVVAIHFICKNPYRKAGIIFLRTLIEKNYNLPDIIMNCIMDHFMSVKEDTVELTVIWHQCLLTFIRYYKKVLTPKQLNDFKNLIKCRNHDKITPEIKKEMESLYH